jgi:hypothetical protein
MASKVHVHAKAVIQHLEDHRETLPGMSTNTEGKLARDDRPGY